MFDMSLGSTSQLSAEFTDWLQTGNLPPYTILGAFMSASLALVAGVGHALTLGS
ncbi:hypothetical protein [Dietzia sp. ANT_WB102]|uniref:hypothetical protein n=1 Tax=Dietzia sp. ANT_WB102 TaxID=2597345 RepID=UPI00165E581A|nr:hypothetical protein [Dietzia sp. ANT_WB102]